MNRSFSVTVGCALAVAGLVGCSSGSPKSEPTSSAAAVSSSPAGSTAAPLTTSSPASSTGSTSQSTSSATTSGSSATSSSPATSSTPMVGGMTECTKAALAEPGTLAAQALGPDNVYSVDELGCADGWAVTSGVLADKSNPSMGAPTSFVFEQQGQFWVLKDKSKVCGTNPITTTPPADAEIPAELFVAGCAAG